MRAKPKSIRQKYDYHRDRALARSLHARIFATVDGRLLIVSGQPAANQLMLRLRSLSDAPARAAMPTPTELGFPSYSDGELSLHGLRVRANALKKWSLALQSEARGNHVGNRRARQIATENQEIELLTARLTEFHQWRRLSEENLHAERSPYVLSARQDTQLQNLLEDAAADEQLPPLVHWLARLVMWLGGRNATLRFLRSLSSLVRPDWADERINRARQLICHLRVIGKRCGKEPDATLYEELRAVVNEVPLADRNAIGLTTKRRGRSLAELCRVLISRCKKTLDEVRERNFTRVAVSLACHAMCDTSQLPIPSRIVNRCLVDGEFEWFDRTTQTLAEQRTKKGYRRLLAALESFDALPEPCQFESIRELLARGAKPGDVEWAVRASILDHIKESGHCLAWLRSFDRRLQAKSLELEYFHLRSVIHVAATKQGKEVMERFAEWLQPFSKQTLSPRVLRSVHRALVEAIAPAVTDLECQEELLDWMSMPAANHAAATTNDARLCEFEPWLRAIASFQERCGEEPHLPGSIAKQLDCQAKQARELEFLKVKIEGGVASDAQHARWEHLHRAVGLGHSVDMAKLRRTIEEVYLTTAFEALRAIIQRATEQRWEKVAGAALPPRSLPRQLEFIRWASLMDGKHRQALRSVVESHRLHGRLYKSHLVGNRDWLARARQRGVETAQWLSGNVEQATVDGQEVTIGVECDPYEIFLMGSYFNTCLSLGNCNELSVLANAYAANRQVIFMRDQRGRVLARQLVAASEDFDLLGYHCYVSVDHRSVEQRQRYIAAMAAYCGRLARGCGMNLTGVGEPEALVDLFWYDDGCHGWHEAGRAAWSAEPARTGIFGPIPETNMPQAV